MSYVADSEESASFDKNYKSKFAKPFLNEKALSFEVFFLTMFKCCKYTLIEFSKKYEVDLPQCTVT